jgi:acyl carrier protein
MPPEASQPLAPAVEVPDREDVLEILREELRAVNDEIPAVIEPDDRLEEAVGLDSLDIIEFVARIEYRYHVLVPDDDWQQLTTLDAIADYMLLRLEHG